MEATQMNTPRKEEVTIKFGKGLVGKPFTTKNGKECVGIKIPNADPADKTPGKPWLCRLTVSMRTNSGKACG